MSSPNEHVKSFSTYQKVRQYNPFPFECSLMFLRLVSAVFWRFQQVKTNLYSYLMLHNFWRHSFNSPQCDLWLVCWSIVAMIALAYLKIILFLERKEISNVSRKFAGVKLIRVSHLSVIFRRWPLFKNFKQ